MPIPETMPVEPEALRALLTALLVVLSPALFLTAVWALVHCFLGYFIFRLDLLLAGTYCGAFGGA
ncbi:MAG: hypothetical protein AMJ81_09590 [Phycisphaerae bacterium SM23_33]|jgi:hypothetical protein|nr:MAG: hypothetical protein AMJ81_09590 [Phycisphaerae bacterium SM23_33]